MMVSTIRLAIASRWRKKRLRAYAHWLRALISSPCSWTSAYSSARTAPSVAGVAGAILAGSGPTSIVGIAPPPRLSSSVIPDPRVDVGVRDVGDQVEDDDRRGGDHQPGHYRVGVLVEEVPDEVGAHAVELE